MVTPPLLQPFIPDGERCPLGIPFPFHTLHMYVQAFPSSRARVRRRSGDDVTKPISGDTITQVLVISKTGSFIAERWLPTTCSRRRFALLALEGYKPRPVPLTFMRTQSSMFEVGCCAGVTLLSLSRCGQHVFVFSFFWIA